MEIFKVFTQDRVQQRRTFTFQPLIVIFYGDLQGFHTEQGSTAQNVDIPVPHRGFYGDLQGFPNGQGSTAQNVDIPVPGGVPEDTHVPGSIEWVQLSDGDMSKTYYWNKRTQATVWKPPPSARRAQGGRYTTGTRTPAPAVLLSLLCLLGDAVRGGLASPHSFLDATPRAPCLWQSVRCHGDA